MYVFVCLLPFCCSLTSRFRHYYFACAIGGQYDGHFCPLVACLIVKFIFVILHVLLADGEISILLLAGKICVDYNIAFAGRRWTGVNGNEQM